MLPCVLVTVFSVLFISVANCEWAYYPFPAKAKQFAVYTENGNDYRPSYRTAIATCNAINATLVQPKTQEELQFIVDAVKPQGEFWLGVRPARKRATQWLGN